MTAKVSKSEFDAKLGALESFAKEGTLVFKGTERTVTRGSLVSMRDELTDEAKKLFKDDKLKAMNERIQAAYAGARTQMPSRCPKLSCSLPGVVKRAGRAVYSKLPSVPTKKAAAKIGGALVAAATAVKGAAAYLCQPTGGICGIGATKPGIVCQAVNKAASYIPGLPSMEAVTQYLPSMESVTQYLPSAKVAGLGAAVVGTAAVTYKYSGKLRSLISKPKDVTPVKPGIFDRLKTKKEEPAETSFFGKMFSKNADKTKNK